MPIPTRSTHATATACCTSASSAAPRRSRAASPFNERRRTMNDIDTVKSTSSDAVARRQRPGYDEAALTPPVDVFEDSTGITLYADLPGVPKDKLHLHA